MNNTLREFLERAADALLFVAGLGMGVTCIGLLTSIINEYIKMFK